MSLKTPCLRSHEAAQSALTHPTPGRGNLGVSWFHTSFNGATVNILRAKYLHKFFIMCLKTNPTNGIAKSKETHAVSLLLHAAYCL